MCNRPGHLWLSSGSLPLFQVVSMLPACHKNAFNYLMAFLRELLQHSGKNHSDGHSLGKQDGTPSGSPASSG